MKHVISRLLLSWHEPINGATGALMLHTWVMVQLLLAAAAPFALSSVPAADMLLPPLLLVLLLGMSCSGAPGGPVARRIWTEDADSTKSETGGVTAFYRLPIFLHASGPLVPPELFRPAPFQAAVPAGLTALLIPPETQQQSPRDVGARAVEARCGMDAVSVRVDLHRLGAWTVPSMFRLGSCGPTEVTSRFIYFHYGLLQCGGDLQVRRRDAQHMVTCQPLAPHLTRFDTDAQSKIYKT